MNRIRSVMLDLAGPTFIVDWAQSVGRFAEVIGVALVAALPPTTRRVGRGVARGEIGGIEVWFGRRRRLRPSRWFWRLNRRREARLMVELLRQIAAHHGPVDLIHSHFYPTAAPIPIVSERTGIPFVHTEHSSHLAAPDPLRLVSPAGRKIARSVFASARAVMLVGEDQLLGMGRLGLEGQVSVVGNPVPSTLFWPARAQAQTGTRLISTGDLIPRKRQALAIAALAQIRQRTAAELHLIGAGPEEEKLRAIAKELGLESAVVFWGRLPREGVADLLRRSDLYLHVAETESFGVAIVEALLSGLPVVTTRCGGVTSELTAEVGSVVEEDDPDAIAQAVVDVLESDAYSDRTSIAAWANERFGAEAVGRRIEAQYGLALGRG